LQHCRPTSTLMFLPVGAPYNFRPTVSHYGLYAKGQGRIWRNLDLEFPGGS